MLPPRVACRGGIACRECRCSPPCLLCASCLCPPPLLGMNCVPAQASPPRPHSPSCCFWLSTLSFPCCCCYPPLARHQLRAKPVPAGPAVRAAPAVHHVQADAAVRCWGLLGQCWLASAVVAAGGWLRCLLTLACLSLLCLAGRRHAAAQPGCSQPDRLLVPARDCPAPGADALPPRPARCAGRRPRRWPRCCPPCCGASTCRTASTCTGAPCPGLPFTLVLPACGHTLMAALLLVLTLKCRDLPRSNPAQPPPLPTAPHAPPPFVQRGHGDAADGLPHAAPGQHAGGLQQVRGGCKSLQVVAAAAGCMCSAALTGAAAASAAASRSHAIAAPPCPTCRAA